MHVSTAQPRARDAGWVCVVLAGWLALAASACAPGIGDNCETALDCATSGTRLCDRTQPHGYCTLEGCEEGTCPDDAVCVQFGLRDDGVALDRLSRTFCMAACDETSDCRDDDGYRCYSNDTFGTMNEARVLGSASQQFCAPIAPKNMTSTAPQPVTGTEGPTPDEELQSKGD